MHKILIERSLHAPCANTACLSIRHFRYRFRLNDIGGPRLRAAGVTGVLERLVARAPQGVRPSRSQHLLGTR